MHMVCNGVLTPPKLVTLPVLKFLTTPVLKLFTTPLRLEMAASAFFANGYLQQAHAHISKAIKTD